MSRALLQSKGMKRKLSPLCVVSLERWRIDCCCFLFFCFVLFFFKLCPVNHDYYICANIERGGDSPNTKGVEMANVNICKVKFIGLHI